MLTESLLWPPYVVIDLGAIKEQQVMYALSFRLHDYFSEIATPRNTPELLVTLEPLQNGH